LSIFIFEIQTKEMYFVEHKIFCVIPFC